MAISDKLNYLIETKQLFKDRLNSLGAEITSSTTFRNYLNWLDTFYGEVSDKTDLSVNGVVGRTSQETNANVFNGTLAQTTYTGTGAVVENHPTIFNFINGYTYTINIKFTSNNVSTINQNRILGIRAYKDIGYTGIGTVISSGNLSSGTGSITFTAEENYNRFSFINYADFQSGTVTITDFEIITNTPTPDYPQPINNLSGNVAYKITTQNGEQTFTIPLGDIELCKIDTYEDKIYSSDGRFYLEKNIDKKFENSFISILAVTSTLADNLYGYACNTRGISRYDKLGAIISNIFVPKILGSQTDTTNPNNVRFNMGIAKHTNTDQVVITIDKKYLEIGTTTEFGNFLNDNNFEYYCVLSTPTTTEITQENYPALYNALKQIQDYLTAYKINKEFILGYSSPEIEY